MDLAEITSYFAPLLIAITLHEAAHAFVANWLGDPTAKQEGRVSLDPVRHIDPFGTILLPGLLLLAHSPALFGYAKPVNVRYDRLRHPRRDGILVAAAGPCANLILAFLFALLIHLDHWITPEQIPWTFMNIYNGVTVNVVLMIFNLLPILPLDGGRILNGLLPRKLARSHAETERYGMMIIVLIFMVPAYLANMHMLRVDPGYYLLDLPMGYVRDGVLHLAGIGDNH